MVSICTTPSSGAISTISACSSSRSATRSQSRNAPISARGTAALNCDTAASSASRLASPIGLSGFASVSARTPLASMQYSTSCTGGRCNRSRISCNSSAAARDRRTPVSLSPNRLGSFTVRRNSSASASESALSTACGSSCSSAKVCPARGEPVPGSCLTSILATCCRALISARPISNCAPQSMRTSSFPAYGSAAARNRQMT